MPVPSSNQKGSAMEAYEEILRALGGWLKQWDASISAERHHLIQCEQCIGLDNSATI